MARAEQENSKGPGGILGRRTLIKAAVLGGSGMLDQGLRLFEIGSESRIQFDPRQQQRLGDTDSICLLFGGATIRSIKPTTDVLLPALEPLGAVGSIEYAKSDIDASSIVVNIRKLQKEYPRITNLSIYTHSLGAQVAGEVLAQLGDEITLKHAFLDCAAPSLAYTEYPRIAQGIMSVPIYDGGLLITMAVNSFAHNAIYKPELAPPGLLWDQFEELEEGERHIASLAFKAESDNARVILLTPANSEKDPIVNAKASEARLRQIFPNLRVAYLKGNQGHANPTVNTDEYLWAIHNAFAESY